MSFQTINPATGEIVRTFPMSSDAEVATALKTADDRYNNEPRWRRTTDMTTDPASGHGRTGGDHLSARWAVCFFGHTTRTSSSKSINLG